ncbi:hypothetical protein V2G26_015927 [Clonostachys chloroleuca]|uniref:Mitochondrial inner membrane protein COX18 n=1 Tax=Clonostachys chloroleuca TaxID=1926264 RepID=A0AA35MH59_9HYPO|nr:unnamed protein product [Clonostachys chloroleuca]
MYMLSRTSGRMLRKGIVPNRLISASRPGCLSFGGRREYHPIVHTFDHAATWTAEAIASIHNAGLPWYLTIPLVAAGVNFTFRLPMQYYARNLAAKRNQLTPLVNAWAWRHRIQEFAATPGKQVDSHARNLASLRAIRSSRRRLYRSWGVQIWKSFLPLTTMFPFVLASEALRRLSGVSVYMGLVTVGEKASAATSTAASALVDPSLTQGGLLWFTDLTVADPYFGLPLLCTAVLASTSWGSLGIDRIRVLVGAGGSQAGTSPMTRGFQRVLLAVPLFPLVVAHLPSAIFVYWLTSFSLTYFNDLILKKIFPMAKARLQPPNMGRSHVRSYLPASPEKLKEKQGSA